MKKIEKEIVRYYVCEVTAPSGKWHNQGKSSVTIWGESADGKTYFIERLGTWPNTKAGRRTMDKLIADYTSAGYVYSHGRP